jgi:hypothetical protein
MTKRQLLGIIGSAILFIGVFMPIVKLPIVGEMNYFHNGRGDGVIILALAVASFVFALIRWYRQLWITSLSSAAVLAFTFFNFQSKMSQATRQMETEPRATTRRNGACAQRERLGIGRAASRECHVDHSSGKVIHG